MPASAELLAPLPADFWTTLDAGLSVLSMELSPGARSAIDAHARLLLAWNPAINLTALRDAEQIARRHVLDSLTAVPLARRLLESGPTKRAAWRVIDLGSGAGYPGLPLALALPAAECALVDSVSKKARFLGVAATATQRAMAAAGERAPALAALAERAEDLADEPEHREAWPLVVARAVGSLAEVCELGLPLVAPGGHLIAWKRDAGDGALGAEVASARALVRQAGGAPPTVTPLADDARLGLPGHVLVSVRKARPTPARFPRPPAERRRAC